MTDRHGVKRPNDYDGYSYHWYMTTNVALTDDEVLERAYEFLPYERSAEPGGLFVHGAMICRSTSRILVKVVSGWDI